MKKIKLKTTEKMRYLRTFLNELESNLPRVFISSIFRKVSVEEKMSYIKEVSHARSKLWEEVYKIYPQTLGKTVNLNDEFVEYEDESDLLTPKVAEE